jgi:hypothetical protein
LPGTTPVYPQGLSPYYPALPLLRYTQSPQPVAGVAQQGPGAGVIVQPNPPQPPTRLVIGTGRAAGATSIPLPAAQTVVTAGIRRQGQPWLEPEELSTDDLMRLFRRSVEDERWMGQANSNEALNIALYELDHPHDPEHA